MMDPCQNPTLGCGETPEAQERPLPSASYPSDGLREQNCPLCGGRKLGVAEQLSGLQLRALWKALGCEFTPEAWGKIHEHYLVVLQRCRTCGFEFFDPSLAGDEAFYRELDHPEYYSALRPEFARTLVFAKRKGLLRVLDVGCGSGGFLDLARQAGCQTHGLELSTAAAEKARAKGHKIFSGLLPDLDRQQTSGEFDLISFFQVLEHVPAPITVLKQAALLLNTGGYISVAVPSAHGVYRLAPWDPHQWPPHHVGRWRLADLDQLGRAAQLKRIDSGGDVLLGSDIAHLWKIHNQLAPVLGKRGWWGGDALAEVISFVYRKSGMKLWFPRRGSSIYGYFQKP